MIVEAVRNNLEGVQAGQAESATRRFLPAVQKILDRQQDFEDTYVNAGNTAESLQRKYELAQALIKDRRYPKRRFLVDKFIPAGANLDPEVQQFATNCRNELKLRLLETGEIDAGSEEGKAIGTYFAGRYQESGEMGKYAAIGLPPGVVAQIAIIEQFEGISDEKKLEELRSWATHAFYRPYIGLLSGVAPVTEPTAVDIMNAIPRQVVTNSYALRYNLVELFFEEQFRQDLNVRGVSGGIEYLEDSVGQITDPDKQQFFTRVYDKVFDMVTTPQAVTLESHITVKDREYDFPSVDQAAFTYCYDHYGTRFLWGKAGLGKTNAVYNTVEQALLKQEQIRRHPIGTVLVMVPAGGRETWEKEEKKVFSDPGNVFVVKGSADLDIAIAAKKRYTVVSHELLGYAKDNPELLAKLHSLIDCNQTVGGILDEIDGFSNPAAKSTQIASELLQHIRRNYHQTTGQSDTPIIGLTATPFRGGLDDLNSPMAMLYPGEYVATRAEATDARKTFSDNCLESPYLTYLKLFGERKMFRWEKAAGVQPFSYETIRVQASPFERELYDFIEDNIGGDALNKIRILENALFNPWLARNEVRRMLKDQVPEVDLEQATELLKKILAEWKKAKKLEFPEQSGDYLSADQLVRLGLGQLVLGCFFSEVLTHGVDTLVDQLARTDHDSVWQELKLFWEPYQVSAKYQAIRTVLDEALSWQLREDGVLVRNKVIIASPSRRQGRTGDVLQKAFKTTEGGEDKLYKQEELDRINDMTLVKLVKHWVKAKGVSEQDVLLIDGSVGIGKQRNTIIDKWTDDPGSAVLNVTVEAVYQSRDYTLNALVDSQGREIAGIVLVVTTPTWYAQPLEQICGRSQRQGQQVPAKNEVLETIGTVEVGKGEGVKYTYLLGGVTLSGVTPNDEDREFIDSKRVGTRILRRNPDSLFFRDFINHVRGAGEQEISRYMDTVSDKEGRSNAQRFAQRYYDHGRDEYRIPGHNAKMVALMIRELGLADGPGLSVGAGTLLLQRMLQMGLDNVDLNRYMMEAGWEKASQYGGRMVVGRASSLYPQLFPTESYQYVDYSFASHWSSLGDIEQNIVEESERVRILCQIDRVQATGGALFLTEPEKAFDDERFIRFAQALETHFGRRIDVVRSGKSFGIKNLGYSERIGWTIVAFKERLIDLTGLRLRNLEFCYDDRRWESRYREESDGGGCGIGPRQDFIVPVNFDRYEIVSPLQTQAKVEGASSIDQVPVVIPTIDLAFLKGETPEDFESYRKDLVRPLRKRLGGSWGDVEHAGMEILKDAIQRRGHLPKNRLVAYDWILKGAWRRQNNHE